jgi:hypothetical protein
MFRVIFGRRPSYFPSTPDAKEQEVKTRRLGTIIAAALGALLILALPAAASAKDRNHDRIPDRWEHKHHLSMKVDQAHRDQDRDQLRNRAEFLAGDNPRDADSDNDGTEDGNENAGHIQSFDASSGRLVITLFGGDTLSGLVDSSTEIKCENENENENENEANDQNDDRQVSARHGDDNSDSSDDSGDNSGPGSDNSGPGRGGDDENENANCTTADLTAGRVVQEADLHTVGGSAVFEEVELGS